MAYLRSFHNQCNQTMVPTEALLQQLSGNGFKRLKVVARGVDTLNFAPTKRSQGLREKWGVYGDDVAVLHVGRLAAEKNLGVLIRAYDKIRSVQPRARLVVVGDGPMRAELQAQFPQAYFAGFQSGEALAAHYASGDMFLFPSLTETYGNVTPEAMASGLGVVAFDDAAAGELIEHRSNGLLAPKTDSAAFVTLAAELARNATLRRQYGDQARSTVLAHGWSEIVRNVEDVYANAIKQSPFSLAHDIRSRLLPV